MTTVSDGGRYVIERVEAQRASTLIQVGAVLGAVVCIALAAALQPSINRQRKDLQLVMQSDIYKELPPEYAWVSAAGATFRGLAADFLWARAEQLKQEGKYYEAYQLAKWICTLQPRFAAVWSFQAWNMSYNISVGTHTPQERWQWVYNGIRLLRDEGIPNNERVVPLYHQLAWTWFHKVGDRLDDMHWHYKRVWAATMQMLLGPPPAGVSPAEAIDWFRPIAEAPRRLDDLIARRPGVAGLVTILAAIGIDVRAETDNARLLHPLEESFFRPYYACLERERLARWREKPAEAGSEAGTLAEVVQKAPREDLDALLAFLRAKVLREQYKMDPRFMLDMTGRLGTEEPIPIDWRTPWSQAMYWALYGTDQGAHLRSVKDFDVISADRILLFSLAALADFGRFTVRVDLEDPMASFLNMLPDTRYVEAMHKKYIEMGKKHAEKGEDVEGRTSEILRSGHVNNLQSAIGRFYLSGREQEAQKYLDYLARYYPDLVTGEHQEMYLGTVKDFIRTQIKDMREGKEVAPLIYSILEGGYLGLVSGWGNEFNEALLKAQWVYREYQKDKLDNASDRQRLPPFVEMRADALAAFAVNGQMPIDLRALVWEREVDDVKRYCYDDVAPYLAAECQEAGLDMDKAFPPPPGLEQWRADKQAQAESAKREKQEGPAPK